MTEKQLFLFCGLWILLAVIFGIMCQDFGLFIWLAGYPVGIMVGWSIVTLIESHKRR